jgi:heme-degrading monooxygenase HmoA
MYARVLRLKGDASKADAAIENYASRVAPALREQGGYAGARLLVDREQGRSMSVTFWRDEDAARASEAALSGIRRDAASAFGADDPVSEYFEILVQHRPLPTEAGNWVRVTNLAGDPAKVDDGVAHYTAQVIPGVEALVGFRAAVLFGDRATGNSMSVTVWTTKSDMDASADAGSTIRAAAAAVMGAGSPTVETFEVGFAELVS